MEPDISDRLADREEDADDDEEEAEAAAAALMVSVQRGFAAAKKAGIPAAQRLMKELQQACASSAGYEIRLIEDSLMKWEVSLFDWAFDEDAQLHKDLKQLSEQTDDLVPLVLRIVFPNDFPFSPPLVYCASPLLASQYIFDGALCMEMLVDWQPTYGNIEALLIQVAAFLAHSNTRVASLCTPQERMAAAGGAGLEPPPQQPPPPPPLPPQQPADEGAGVPRNGAGPAVAAEAAGACEAANIVSNDEQLQAKAKAAYDNLKRYHQKKGWGHRQQRD